MNEGPASMDAPRWLLVAGLAAGIVLGALGIAERPLAGLPDDAVARVNGRLILRDEWLRAVAAVSSERRTPLTDADQRHILDRLVDEELLVQHGVALGLVESDARLRSLLVSEVMLVAARRAAQEPDEAALRKFYEEQRDFFAPAPRLRVQGPGIPDVLLPHAKLVAYVGPTLAQRVAGLAPGESVEAEGGAIRLVEREPSAAPPFEQVAEQVRAEWRRRNDEAAVRALLARLREANRIDLRGLP